MNAIKNWWRGFVDKHPELSKWIREGGLFVLVSNLITVFKYFLLTFLPAAFAFLGSRDFGFPGINLTLFGIEFKWYIIGYGADQGGIAYFTAYMIAMVIGEVINFFIQRGWVFRSKGNIAWQALWYVLAFCISYYFLIKIFHFDQKDTALQRCRIHDFGNRKSWIPVSL